MDDKNFKKHGLTKALSYSKLSLVLSGQVKCASGSAVEHLLAKEGVAGSIPVSRSFLFLEQSGNFVFCVTFRRNERISEM